MKFFRFLKKRSKKQKMFSKVSLSALLGSILFAVFVPTTLAASVTTLSDNVSRLKASTLADHEIKFVTPTGVESNTDTITLTFGGGFTIGSFAVANVDFAVGNSGVCSSATFTEKTLAASANTGVWGVAQASSTITLTAPTDATTGEVTAGRCVRARIGSNAVTGASGTTQITNGSAGATDATVTIGGTFGDSGSLFVPIITDDQVNITATVDPSITFSISDNTIGFGTLSASAARWATGNTNGQGSETSAHTLAAGTNATSGYIIYVKGATLTSGGNSIDAIGGTAATSSTGTEQFGFRLTASGGSGAAIAPYNDTTPKWAYAANSSTQDDIAQATGASATTTYSVYYIANIGSSTEAGLYTTDLTYTAVASF